MKLGVIQMRYVKGYEGRYSVTREGKVYSHLSNKFMSVHLDKDGYERTGLTNSDQVQTTEQVHRLVAVAFVDGEDNLIVNHKDGVKTNNHCNNLEWCTYKYNRGHALATGLVSKYRVYGEDLAHKVISYTMDGWTKKEISEALGQDLNSVHNIMFSPSYKFIRDEYQWENRPNKTNRMSTDKIMGICKELENGMQNKDLMNKFNINSSTLYYIKSRKYHTRISQNYNF